MLVVQFLVWPFLHEELSICSKLFLDCRCQSLDGMGSKKRAACKTLMHMSNVMSKVVMVNVVPHAHTHIYIYMYMYMYMYMYIYINNPTIGICILFDAVPFHCILLQFVVFQAMLLSSIVRYCTDILTSLRHYLGKVANIRYPTLIKRHSYCNRYRTSFCHTSCVNVSGTWCWILSFQYHAS